MTNLKKVFLVMLVIILLGATVVLATDNTDTIFIQDTDTNTVNTANGVNTLNRVNSINTLKCPNEPRKIAKFNTTLLLFYVDTRKNLKAIRGSGYHFVPEGGTFATETIRLLVRSSAL